MSPDNASLLARAFTRTRRHRFFRSHYAGVHDVDAAAPINKQTLLAALASFAPRDEARGVYLVRSGGSTHEPLVFPVDIRENLAQRRMLAAALQRSGMFRRDSMVLNIFGYSDLYRSAAIVDDLLERCGATTLPVSAHARYEDMVHIARRFGPGHVAGTPSKLALLGQFLASRDQRLNIPELVYAGEVIHASTRKLLAERLGTRRIWSLYGGAETGIWAWSDASHEPDLFRVLPGVVVEVLDPDARGYGSLMVTNTYRRRFPLFRYLVGDRGRLVVRDAETCLELCGRDRRSFHFDEMIHDYEPFRSLAGPGDEVQIQLRRTPEHRDELTLLICSDAAPVAMAALRARLAAMLQHPENSGAVLVRQVTRDGLHVDPTNAKTPAIVDLRR